MLPSELHAAQVRQGEATALLSRREWRKLRTLDDWPSIADRLTLIVSAGQLGAARASVAASLELIGEGVGSVDPAAFAGVASDGRPLGSLLYSSVAHSRSLYGSGGTDAEIMQAGESHLKLLVRTQVADAWRAAAGVSIASTPNAGYVRVVQPPCCQRCAVLAGKFFKWNTGFQRHPRCDCLHQPVAGSAYPPGYVSEIDPSQIRDLTEAQRKAITDGADVNRTINAYRNGKRGALTTSAGTVNGRIRGRLTPEAIYARAGDNRQEAVRLLGANGYVRNVGRLAA